MKDFDSGLQAALKMRKYDVLTGRSVDLRAAYRNFRDRLFEKYVVPFLQKMFYNLLGYVPNYNTETIKRFFIVICAVFAIAAAVFIFLKIRRKKNASLSVEDLLDSLQNGAVTYADLLAQALQLSQNGNFRDAVRFEYAALLWALNIKGVIVLTDNKTNNALLREAAGFNARYYPDFSKVIGAFNAAWFGHKTISAQKYAQNRERVLKLIGTAEGQNA